MLSCHDDINFPYLLSHVYIIIQKWSNTKTLTFTPTYNLDYPISLAGTFSNLQKKPENPQSTHTEEHANSWVQGPRIEPLLWGGSANHCTSMSPSNVINHHLDFFYHLSGVGSRGQQSQDRSPNFPVSFLTLPAHPAGSQGIFPGVSSQRPLPGNVQGACETNVQATSANPTQWGQLKLLQGDWALHPLPKGSPSHAAKETHFGHMYSRSGSFSHYPKLLTIGESRTENRSVNREPRPTV